MYFFWKYICLDFFY